MPRCAAWRTISPPTWPVAPVTSSVMASPVIMSATRTGAPVCAERVIASVVASVTVPPRPLEHRLSRCRG